MQLLVPIGGPSPLCVVPALVRWARLHKKHRSQRASKSVSSVLHGLCFRFQIQFLTPGVEYDLGLEQPNKLFLPQVSFGNGVITATECKPEQQEFFSFPRYLQGVPHHTVICNIKFCSLLTVLHIAGFFILVIINSFFIYTLSHQISNLRGQMLCLILFFKG